MRRKLGAPEADRTLGVPVLAIPFLAQNLGLAPRGSAKAPPAADRAQWLQGLLATDGVWPRGRRGPAVAQRSRC